MSRAFAILPGLVNAGKREKSERGGKPKEWEREGEAGVARKSIKKARDVGREPQQAW